MWIDRDDYCGERVGDIGFLVLTVNENRGSERFSLRDRPARTNQSLEP